MPKLFWIGSPFFSHALTRYGWDVRFHNFEDIRVFDWKTIVALADGEPDAVVVADKSRPPFVLGQEEFPCPTALYAVDTHIHSWLPLYAQSFDLCLVSLRDHLPRFQNQRLTDDRVMWSPPYALSSLSAQSMPHQWPCLFVGTVDTENTPRRARFLAALKEKLPGLHVTRGAYSDLYPQADIVLNISEQGDLNFRVFEALGCGACLVTPYVRHGLETLFTTGKELATYPELDVDAAYAVIQQLLEHPDERERMAQAGLAAVDAQHRDIHRAEALTAALHSIHPAESAHRKASAPKIHSRWLRPVYLHFAEQLRNPTLRAAYLAAATKDKNRSL